MRAQVVPRSTQARLDRGAALDTEYFRGLIEQKKTEAKARLTQIREKLAGSMQFFGLTHAADFNPPLNQADNWALINAQKVILRSDEALRRINLGVYGICIVCRQPIDKQRLEVIPFAPKCIVCKAPSNED